MAEKCAKHAERTTAEQWHEIESAENVFVDILSRLPAKSLLSYRTVSRYWHRSISNKAFVNMHLSRSREMPFLIACPRFDKVMKLYLMKPEAMVHRRLISLPYFGNSSGVYMVCSFNGLICCINSLPEEEEDVLMQDLEIRICNPATGGVLLLPQGSPSFETEPSIGVAYGPDISEYKVFRIFCAGEQEPEEHDDPKEYSGSLEAEEFEGSVRSCRYECEVYSSSTGSWRNIGPAPRIPMHIAYGPYASGHVFVGGRIYWLVESQDDHTTPGSLLSVDMDGNFRVINLPEYSEDLHDEDKITPTTFLINLQGSLSLVVLHVEHMDIWVLKEEGREPAWESEREDYIRFSPNELVQFVTVWNNKLLFATEDYWCTYDLGSKIWKTVREPRRGLISPVAFTYTESLLPCNGGLNPQGGE